VNAIQISEIGSVKVFIPDESQMCQSKVLVISAEIVSVANADEQSLCVGAMQNIKAYHKAVEQSRVSVKAPVLELTRRIDEIAREATAETNRELARLDGLLTPYVSAEREKALAAERARQTELARIEQVRIEAETSAMVARQKAATVEAAARKAAEVPRPKKVLEDACNARATALQEAAAYARKLDAINADVARVQQQITDPAKVAGLSVREEWTFEVLDYEELLKVKPAWVVCDVRRSDVNRAIAAELRECPGLRIYKQVKAGVRV
jgi:hypothetical protein